LSCAALDQRPTSAMLRLFIIARIEIRDCIMRLTPA
jgi:hypothetical protein